MPNRKLNLRNILPPTWTDAIDLWLKEDMPSMDYGSYVVGDGMAEAILYCKSPGVLSGVPFFEEIFRKLGCSVTWIEEEGTMLTPAKKIPTATVRGPANRVLQGERLALNILSRCSGVATEARKLSDLLSEAEWHGSVAGTRKTTPGFRMVEKYGLLVGGADTHRYDLSGMVMLKDNHIKACGGIGDAVREVRKVAGFSLKVEVECGHYDDAAEALSAGADVVMLDNMSPDVAQETARKLRQIFTEQTFTVEASGGINADTIAAYACPHIDILSVGGLTNGYPSVDFSLKIEQPAEA
eukprot:Rmarinus@m.13299